MFSAGTYVREEMIDLSNNSFELSARNASISKISKFLQANICETKKIRMFFLAGQLIIDLSVVYKLRSCPKCKLRSSPKYKLRSSLLYKVVYNCTMRQKFDIRLHAVLESSYLCKAQLSPRPKSVGKLVGSLNLLSLVHAILDV